VEFYEKDNKGRSAMHHAIKSGNLHYIKFLVDIEKLDVNETNNKGANCINILL
jgi:ankyrin repeat protein